MIDLARIVQETFVAQAEHHPTLSSTNDRATWCASRGAKQLPLLVVADQQTAGRGRGGKRWWSAPGALMFSLLIEPDTVAADRDRSPLVALAVAVAVAETVAPLLAAQSPGIHWPNDVLVNGRKLTGILVEVLADRRHVIGIGLNTNNTLADAPAELQATATTLRDLAGQRFDQTDVLVDLLRHLADAFSMLRDDPSALSARANARCTQRGQTVTLHWGNQHKTGVCRGIGADGAILLETAAGVERFHSGTTSPQ
ncbi:MAG: biotin--[acetyl-CoA-carboxylase] ligase [Planctomycetaceae bacterium]|nr:biotin--[acetyl-CoA-carboxylase] ligase [Planctomycetaceae bacterium]